MLESADIFITAPSMNVAPPLINTCSSSYESLIHSMFSAQSRCRCEQVSECFWKCGCVQTYTGSEIECEMVPNGTSD